MWESYHMPDPKAPGRFDEIEKRLGADDVGANLFRIGTLRRGPMHLLDHMLGFEQFMVFLVEYPERIQRLLDAFEEWHLGLIDGYAALGSFDAIIIYDDQAMQTGPYFSMEVWRRFFKRWYARIYQHVHESGMKMLHHTCGNIEAHLPELADCGVDVIHNTQPYLWKDSPAARALRGRIAFSSCIAMTRLLRMTPDEVTRETVHVIRQLGTPDGGFIGTIFGMIDPKMPQANADALWAAYADFSWTENQQKDVS
jgi:uroporphyrinogen decarboxylase